MKKCRWNYSRLQKSSNPKRQICPKSKKKSARRADNDKPTCIKLFAGVGGLALGIEKAGFKTIGLIENDKDACATLRKNRPNWNVLKNDIKDLGLSFQSCLSWPVIPKSQLGPYHLGLPTPAASADPFFGAARAKYTPAAACVL